jgi:hypothetical protein
MTCPQGGTASALELGVARLDSLERVAIVRLVIMKRLVSGFVLVLGVSISCTALAQQTAAPAPAQPPPAPAQPQPLPPPPTQTPVAAPAPSGQWVYTDAYGWIWVPAGASTYEVGAQPYVYLYTPAYGWTWYVSPWGWGPYYVGPWVHRAWGVPHVWYGGRWVGRPRIVVQRPVVVAPRAVRVAPRVVVVRHR